MDPEVATTLLTCSCDPDVTWGTARRRCCSIASKVYKLCCGLFVQGHLLLRDREVTNVEFDDRRIPEPEVHLAAPVTAIVYFIFWIKMQYNVKLIHRVHSTINNICESDFREK